MRAIASFVRAVLVLLRRPELWVEANEEIDRLRGQNVEIRIELARVSRELVELRRASKGAMLTEIERLRVEASDWKDKFVEAEAALRGTREQLAALTGGTLLAGRVMDIKQ